LISRWRPFWSVMFGRADMRASSTEGIVATEQDAQTSGHSIENLLGDNAATGTVRLLAGIGAFILIFGTVSWLIAR
jgi:hypothetical protein